MAAILKVNIVNEAFAWCRISGLTKRPTPEELERALSRLEAKAHQLEGRNMCVGYNFEDTPDPNAVSNIPEKHRIAFETSLAEMLNAYYGKVSHANLTKEFGASMSFLSSDTAPLKQTPYPRRQPIGSGNRFYYSRWQNFFWPGDEAPLGCETNKMFIGNTNDFVEHFDSWLKKNEEIASYTIEANSGLTIVSSSFTATDVLYEINATGTDDGSGNGLQQVKIIATTDDPRIQTRIINFELMSADIGT